MWHQVGWALSRSMIEQSDGELNTSPPGKEMI
jgi:hypothetical protein